MIAKMPQGKGELPRNPAVSTFENTTEEIVQEPAFAEFRKADDELQIVWAEVYIPDIPDTQGDFMQADEIRKMAHAFLSKGSTQNVDIEHNGELCGAIVVESFVARPNDPDFIVGSWVVGVHVPSPAVWNLIKSGELNGFSMQGTGTQSSAEVVLEIPEVLTGVAKSADNHVHGFTVRFAQDGRFLGGETTVDAAPGGVAHKHEIKRGTITEEADGHAHRFSFLEALTDAQGSNPSA